MEVKVPCCPEKAEVKFDCDCSAPLGRITGYLPAKCIDGTKIVIYDTAGNVVWSGVPNTDGFFDTGCKIKCNDVYKVVPRNEQCKFTPESMEVKVPCCPEKAEVKFDCDCAIYNGRIVVYMPKECIDGTKVIIYDMQGSVVLTLQPNSDGVFDTGCKLLCPSAYRVVPRNEKCKFSPEYIDVKVPCCPDYAKVEFKCDCSSNFGRIVCYIPSNCIDGTKVVITDSAGNSVWSGVPNANGMIDTDCTLKCNTAYKVIPRNEKCTFSPTSIDVKLPCCPEYAKVEFKCDCAEPKGRIVVSMPDNCLKGTTVLIYKGEIMPGKRPVAQLTYNRQGLFDSDCTLECNISYTIKPSNENCKFYPETQTVKLPCCPEYSKVEFKCECTTPKGRVIVSMPDNCLKGTSILVYEGDVMPGARPVATLYANDQGTFDSDCTLKCGVSYTLLPNNDNCKFSPETQTVKLPCCPEYAKTAFKCECEELPQAKPSPVNNLDNNYPKKETYLSNDMEVLKIKIK
jgi:hypothetical protein